MFVPHESGDLQGNGGGGNRTRETFPPMGVRPVALLTRGESDWLYFIQAVDGGPVKIGRAANPRKRLRDFQSGNPKPLRIIAALEDAGDIEFHVHHLLRNHRIRGEWFSPYGATAFLIATGITPDTLRDAGVAQPAGSIPADFMEAAAAIWEGAA